MAPLTPKQARFVNEYLVDLNATQAVLRAGYKMSEKAAATQGGRLLRKAEIQKALQEAREAQEARTQITADRVLRELAAIAFADAGDYQTVEGDELALLDSDRIPADKRRAIQGYRRGKFGPEVVLADKLKALELIGKHLGMFERPEDTDGQGVRVVLDSEAEEWSE